MRRTPLLIVALVLVLLGGATAGAVAYDRAHADRLAKGVRVNGVDVSGLTATQARAQLERVLLEPLREPLVVDHGKRQWRLTAREARIASDLDGAVARALEVSRGGGLPVRVWRDLTGRRLDEEVDSGITYSKKAVVRLLDRIRKDLERDPVDARVTFSAAGPQRVPGRTGRALRASELHRQLRAAIVEPEADRRFVARTKKVRPKTTDADLERKFATVLIVDRPSFRIRLYKRLELRTTYPIALGKAGNDTPSGLYTIQNKAIDPVWNVPDSDWAGELRGKQIPPGPDNPIKARWMGIYDGVGVHGTSDRGSIGSNASHGCIRMLEEDVIALYDDVPVGTPIYIS